MVEGELDSFGDRKEGNGRSAQFFTCNGTQTPGVAQQTDGVAIERVQIFGGNTSAI